MRRYSVYAQNVYAACTCNSQYSSPIYIIIMFSEVFEYFTNSESVLRSAPHIAYSTQYSLDSKIWPLQISKYSPNPVLYNII